MTEAAHRRPTLTKIIATIGTPGTPSANEESIERLIRAGASFFRLNFSHGKLEEHAKTLEMLRAVEKKIGQYIGVFGDLSGPKIRVGPIEGAGVTVLAGQDVRLVRRHDEVERYTKPNEVALTCNYEGLVDDVEIGHRVLINDGAIRMLAVDKTEDAVICRVMVGGRVSTGKGINLPNTALNVEPITERDWRCLDWAIRQELELVAMSFVRRADEVRAIRNRIEQLADSYHCRKLPVIAKIEKPEAIDNIEEILESCDGIMIARGDLGVEMDLSEVPVIQKRLVSAASRHGKPCIVATQMLETMIENPTPTRAEASDVANAIFEGADAVMLSGETAVGKYATIAVDTMSRIIHSTESYIRGQDPVTRIPERLAEEGHWTVALAHGAWTIAQHVGAEVIVTYSKTGVTALHLSQYRFRAPILAFSDDHCTLRRMNLLFGVAPAYIEEPESLDEFTDDVDRWLLERDFVDPGAPIILIAGHPIGAAGSTNSLAVHYVGDPTTGYRGH